MKRDTISMCCFKPITVLLLLILLTSIPFSASQSYKKNANDDPIDIICKATPFYDLCKSILSPLPQIPDLKGVALVMVKNILGNANDTLSYIQDLIKKTSDEQLLLSFSFCAETYIPLVKYTLPQGIDYINQSRFGFASYSVSYSMKEVNKCSKIFKGSTQQPLVDRISVIQKLGDDASSIINQLWKPPSPPPSHL